MSWNSPPSSDGSYHFQTDQQAGGQTDLQRETGCELARSVHSSHKAIHFCHSFVLAEVVAIVVDVYYCSGGV